MVAAKKNLALSDKQFGAGSGLATLHSNLTRAGYTTSSRPGAGVSRDNKMSSGMETFRSNLKSAAMGSATSSQHSLGAALNANPSTFAPVAQPGPSKFSEQFAKIRAGAAKAGKAVAKAGLDYAASRSGGSNPRGKNTQAKKRNPHAGNNAVLLKAATGAK